MSSAGLKILSLTDSRQHDTAGGSSQTIGGAPSRTSSSSGGTHSGSIGTGAVSSVRGSGPRGASSQQEPRRRQDAPSFRIEFHEVEKSAVRMVYSDEMYMAKTDWEALPRAAPAPATSDVQRGGGAPVSPGVMRTASLMGGAHRLSHGGPSDAAGSDGRASTMLRIAGAARAYTAPSTELEGHLSRSGTSHNASIDSEGGGGVPWPEEEGAGASSSPSALSFAAASGGSASSALATVPPDTQAALLYQFTTAHQALAAVTQSIASLGRALGIVEAGPTLDPHGGGVVHCSSGGGSDGSGGVGNGDSAAAAAHTLHAVSAEHGHDGPRPLLAFSASSSGGTRLQQQPSYPPAVPSLALQTTSTSAHGAQQPSSSHTTAAAAAAAAGGGAAASASVSSPPQSMDSGRRQGGLGHASHGSGGSVVSGEAANDVTMIGVAALNFGSNGADGASDDAPSAQAASPSTAAQAASSSSPSSSSSSSSGGGAVSRHTAQVSTSTSSGSVPTFVTVPSSLSSSSSSSSLPTLPPFPSVSSHTSISSSASTVGVSNSSGSDEAAPQHGSGTAALTPSGTSATAPAPTAAASAAAATLPAGASSAASTAGSVSNGGTDADRLRNEVEALTAAKRKLMVEQKKLVSDLEERGKEITVLKQKLSRAGVHV